MLASQIVKVLQAPSPIPGLPGAHAAADLVQAINGRLLHRKKIVYANALQGVAISRDGRLRSTDGAPVPTGSYCRKKTRTWMRLAKAWFKS